MNPDLLPPNYTPRHAQHIINHDRTPTFRNSVSSNANKHLKEKQTERTTSNMQSIQHSTDTSRQRISEQFPPLTEIRIWLILEGVHILLLQSSKNLFQMFGGRLPCPVLEEGSMISRWSDHLCIINVAWKRQKKCGDHHHRAQGRH